MLRRILLAVLSAGLVVGAAVAAPETAGAAAKPTITATWKSSGGKINQTTATLKGFALATVPNFGFDIPNPGAPSPRATVTGSYAGTNNASAHAHINIPDTSKCDPTTTPSGKVKKAKGIKKIEILDGSTLTIS